MYHHRKRRYLGHNMAGSLHYSREPSKTVTDGLYPSQSEETMTMMTPSPPDSRDYLYKASLVTLNWCRRSIGDRRFLHCGHFVECGLSSIVCSYLIIWNYPIGDFTLTADLSAEYNVLTMSDDGRYLYLVSQETMILKYDLSERVTLVRRWEGHCGAPVSCLDSRGQWLVSGSDDHSVRLWQVRPVIGGCCGSSRSSSASLNSGDGRFLLSSDDTIQSAGSLSMSSGSGGDSTATSGSLNNNSYYYCFGDWTTSSSMYQSSLHFPRLLITFKGHTRPVTCVKFEGGRNHNHSNPFGQDAQVAQSLARMRLVSCSEDKSIRVWSLRSGECLRCLSNGHSDKVMASLYLGAGRLVSGSWGNSLRLWDLRKSECLVDINNVGHIPILCLSRNSNRSLLISCNIYDTTVWNVPSMSRFYCFTKYESGVACFHPNKAYLLAIHSRYYRRLQLFDLANQQYVCIIKHRTDIITDLRFTPDGSRLVALELNPVSSAVKATVFDLSQ